MILYSIAEAEAAADADAKADRTYMHHVELHLGLDLLHQDDFVQTLLLRQQAKVLQEPLGRRRVHQLKQQTIHRFSKHKNGLYNCIVSYLPV